MALFLCPLFHVRFYGGRVGQPSGWPVTYYAGSPTLHVRHPVRNGSVEYPSRGQHMSADTKTIINADSGKSFTPVPVKNEGPAGWIDLLLVMEVAYGASPTMESERLNRVQVGAENMLDVIYLGMSAMSELQWIACSHNEYEPETETFRQLGHFQKALFELTDMLRVMRGAAFSRVYDHELAANCKS